MENKMIPPSGSPAPEAGGGEEMVNGVPHRLLDGYDGGEAPDPSFIEKLMAGAPPELRARAAEFAKMNASAAPEAGAAPEAEKE